ncbi:c-type cytochrome [Granulicella sp. WH15]|uniref:c-type cytochrome n=1 Tax=Granulicella sp. WH15 TaxID=2602070 RepID=UPI0013669F71|nr:cytochrome c [Granulicella sp. WH15]QHN02584.1 c-type cytochrome [Granulicella sp. WH15]
MKSLYRVMVLAALVLPLAGCHLPGKPRLDAEDVRPDEVKDFTKLYASNCSACHGSDGSNGPSIALANPVYQAIVSEDDLRKSIANGGPGKLMPAFAQSAGGMLTDAQVEVLVKGIHQRWYKPGYLEKQIPPPYKADVQGDGMRGQQSFQTYCVSCHSDVGGKKASGGSVTDRSYLALVSDQSLRNTIIAGRPDLGHPDWRSALQGHSMSDQEVTDIVTWMAAQRQADPTQPGQGKEQPRNGGEETHE